MIKHRDDEIPDMGSDKDYLMMFGNGLYIHADKNEESQAYACFHRFVHPKKTGNLTISMGVVIINKLSKQIFVLGLKTKNILLFFIYNSHQLFFAGDNCSCFKWLDIEVWGLH